MQANTVTDRGASTPATTGRSRVRAMAVSMRRSTAWLKAAPAAAPSPMPAAPAEEDVDRHHPRHREEHSDHRGEDDGDHDLGLAHLEVGGQDNARTAMDPEPESAAAALARGTVMVFGLIGDAS